MSKKDYIALARAIYTARYFPERYTAPVSRGALNEAVLYAGDAIRDAIADVLALDNPAFDRARFLEACETGTTKGMPR